jgi:replicative DNA helicase
MTQDVTLPPHDLEAEQAVLGAMLINDAALYHAATMLKDDDFYRFNHGKLFHTIVDMYAKSEQVDAVTVSARADADDKPFIHTLSQFCLSASNIKTYVDIVRSCSVRRSLVRAGNEIAEIGYETEHREPEKLIDDAESKLTGLRPDTGQHVHKVRDMSIKVLDSIRNGEKPKMISTGFESIDKYAKGLYGSNLVILGARPGVGKTCLGLSVAQKVAAVGGTVAYFSLEMRAAELTERLLASIACVSLTKIRERSITPDEQTALDKAQAELDKCDLQLIDDSTLSLLSLAGKVRAMAKKDLKLVVVDYLQLMNLGGRAENRREEVSEMSRRLKSLAMEVDVPIIALSQLNRMSTFDGGKVDISQLKESGSLEQDADMVWLMDWPKGGDDFGSTKSVELKVAKNRHGPQGTVDLIWLPQYQRYEE